MKCDDVLTVLRQHADELRVRGIRHAAVFGSIARGDATTQSDIEVMIDLAPNLRIGVHEYVELKEVSSSYLTAELMS